MFSSTNGALLFGGNLLQTTMGWSEKYDLEDI